MHKNKLIFTRPQTNLLRNTFLIYIVLVILTFVLHYANSQTLKESVFIFSVLTAPILFVELLAARTFWRKFTFDSFAQILYVEHFFLLFKYGKVEKISFKNINVTVGLSGRQCLDNDGTFWCVYVFDQSLEKSYGGMLSKKFNEHTYIINNRLKEILPEKVNKQMHPLENRLLKMSAEKTKNKILQFLNQAK
ncbi:MAG: hypothetical protein WCY05_01130 [Candidatus Omnitrophota bacterium]